MLITVARVPASPFASLLLYNFLSDIVSLALKFNPESDSFIWKDKLLTYCSEITLDDDVVYDGLSRGLELGSQNQLALPSEQLFNYHHITTFIVGSKIMKLLHIQ